MELVCELNGKKYLRMDRLFYITWRFNKNKEKIREAFEEIGAIDRKLIEYKTPWFSTPYVILEFLVPVDKIEEFREIDIREIIRRR